VLKSTLNRFPLLRDDVRAGSANVGDRSRVLPRRPPTYHQTPDP
jgi:hypothetical protein